LNRKTKLTTNYAAPAQEPTRLITLASDLTDATYAIERQSGLREPWMEMHLDIWKVLAGATEPELDRSRENVGPVEPETWRDGLLERLTDAVRQRMQARGPREQVVEIERQQRQALRKVIEDVGPPTTLRSLFGSVARAVADGVVRRMEQRIWMQYT
jgi:hypothetical protein